MSVRDCENEDFGRKTRVKCHVKRMMRVVEENEDETDMPKKYEVFCSNISVDVFQIKIRTLNFDFQKNI